MRAFIITAEEIKSSEGRNYNPQLWEANVERMVSKYKDVVFYHVPKGNGYDYERYYVEYTIPEEGLRLFAKFSYSSSMTNGGFYRLDKHPVTKDGKFFKDGYELAVAGDAEGAKAIFEELETTKEIELVEGMFTTGHGVSTRIAPNTSGRNLMIEKSIEYGLTFTKGF